MDSLNITYILLHFPYFTETFVAEEIQAIGSQGVDIRIVSVLGAGPGPVQPLSQQLMPDTWYAPRLSRLGLWRANLHYLVKSPRLYGGLLHRLLRQTSSEKPWLRLTKRLVVFLKAVAVAYHLRDSDVQLLHAHFAWLSGAAAWICSRLTGIPYTVTVHAYDIYVSSDLLSLVCNEADHIVAISEYNRQQVESRTGRRAEGITVIHCGVDMSLLPLRKSAEMHHRAGEPIRVLSVGSLTAKKGHRYLVAACELLKQRGLDFICTIVGTGSDELALRQQIRASGLQDRVKLRGACLHPDVVAAYYEHDLFALASVVAPTGDRDGIPVVLMEAGAAGLPLVSTKVSGIPELVRHGQTGWLVPPGDAAALADAIAALAADPGLRARLGQGARALVEAEFTIESNAARLAALFREVHHQWPQTDEGSLSQAVTKIRCELAG